MGDPVVDTDGANRRFVYQVITHWQGDWDSGLTYSKGDMVKDGEWVMVALTDTTDRAAPQPSGTDTWTYLADPEWMTETVTGSEDAQTLISTGMSFFFETPATIKKYRYWIPSGATATYDVSVVEVTADDGLIVSSLDSISGTDAWAEQTMTPRLVLPGGRYDLDITAQLGASVDETASYVHFPGDMTIYPDVDGRLGTSITPEGYGLDLSVEYYIVSPDWEIVSYGEYSNWASGGDEEPVETVKEVHIVGTEPTDATDTIWLDESDLVAAGTIEQLYLTKDEAETTYLPIDQAQTIYLPKDQATTLYLPLAGGTLTNELTIDGGGGSTLALKPGSSDHVYLEFYARTASPATRSAFIGYSSAGIKDLSISNAEVGGSINLLPESTGRVLVSRNMEVWTGGLQVGKVSGSGWWGISAGDPTASVDPRILVGSPAGNQNVYVIAGAAGTITLRANNSGSNEFTLTSTLASSDVPLDVNGNVTGNMYIAEGTAAAYWGLQVRDGAGTSMGGLYVNPPNAQTAIYGGSSSSGTAGTLFIERDNIVSMDVYRATSTSAANVLVGTSGKLQRSTSSFRYKRDIWGTNGYPVSGVPPERGLKTKRQLPDASKILEVQPATWTPDNPEEGVQTKVGLVTENLAAHCPWAVTPDGEAPDWNQVTASLLHVIKEQSKQIQDLTTRIEVLEAAAW